MPARAIPRIKTRDGNSYLPSEFLQSSESPQKQTFRHDPYGTSTSGKVYVSSGNNSPRNSNDDGEAALPTGTLHAELWSLVSFLPYPSTSFVQPPDTIYPSSENGDEVKRIFFGQLPYFITEMQLSWILYTFGGRHVVTSPERIIKRNPKTGVRQVTGCIHAFASAEGLATMARLCHKKLLIDDTGVWFCRNEEERAVLSDYCLAMKRDIKLRPWERPYDSVVVQEATSGSQSQAPAYLNPQQQHRVTMANQNQQQRCHFDNAAFSQFQHGNHYPRQNNRHSEYSSGYNNYHNNNYEQRQQQLAYNSNAHCAAPETSYHEHSPSDGEDYVAQ